MPDQMSLFSEEEPAAEPEAVSLAPAAPASDEDAARIRASAEDMGTSANESEDAT